MAFFFKFILLSSLRAGIGLGILLSLSWGDPLVEATRISAANQGYEALKEGDLAYQNGAYRSAVSHYEKALQSVDNVPATAVLYEELTQRYATAAIEYSKELSRTGRSDEALQLLDLVLSEDLAPHHLGAQRQRDILQDALRTNPALNADHVRHIEQVRQGLYRAEGAYNLGKYEQAVSEYEQVLKIDPYNKAARLGIERITHQKAQYGKSAKDEARAQMLAAVDEGWELKERQKVDETLASVGILNSEEGSDFRATVASQLESIMIPAIDFEGVDLQEAVEFLRQQSRLHDQTTLDPAKKGVQFILRLEPDDPVRQRTIRLQLSNVPLKKALESVTSLAGVSYLYDEFGVVVSSGDALTSSQYVKSYSVPPDFLSRRSENQTSGDDPFSSIGNDRTFVGQKVSAKQVLTGYGVEFGEGASATFIASSNSLVVNNTEKEHQQIGQILQSLIEEQPTMVVLEVKLISVEQNKTEETGFEWSIDNFVENLILAGGSVGNQEGLNLSGRPLTAGNRSGDNVFQRDSISDVINRVQGVNGTLFQRFDPFQREAGINNNGRLAQTQVSNGTATELLPRANAPGVFSSFVTLSDNSVLNTMLRGLQQSKGTDFISTPKVVTRSGQVAKVTTGREFIYPTEYEAPEISDALEEDIFIIADDGIGYVAVEEDLEIFEIDLDGNDYQPFGYSITPSHPTAFETTILGSELEVEPVVSSDKKTIQLNLKNLYRDFEGFINYGSPISVPVQKIEFEENWLRSTAGLFFRAISGDVGGGILEYDEYSDDQKAELAASLGINNEAEYNAYIDALEEAVDDGDLDGDEIFIFPVFDIPLIPNLFNRLLPFTNLSGIRVEQLFFEASKNNIVMPVFKKINTETSVTIADGATVVLGGLIESKRVPYADKTPILGDLPFLGRAFRSEGMSEVNKVVLLTVTARCIDPSGRPINQ